MHADANLYFQAWINRTVARETSLENIALEDLVAGKAGAFVAVHSAAVLSLVTDSVRIKAEIVPETLLMDTLRLVNIQRDYTNIVNGAVVLIMAHRVVGDKPPMQEQKRSVLKDLEDMMAGGSDFDTIKADFRLALDTAGVDQVASGKLLESIKACITNEGDAVRQLM